MSVTEALGTSPTPYTEQDSYVAPATSEVASPSETPSDVETGGQRQSEHVPYNRFQEVNSRLSAITARAKAYGYDDPMEFIAALEEQPSGGEEVKYAEVDPVQVLGEQVQQLQMLEAERTYAQQFESLFAKYPQADRAEVKELLLHGQHPGTEAAMQANHNRNETKRQRFIADYNRTQQQRQESAVEGAGGGSSAGGVDYSTMTRGQREKLREDIKSGRVAPPGS